MLPKLTPLQYLVLHLLFVGSQSGDDLRHALHDLGVCQSHAAFSRMMVRLIESNYVDPKSATSSNNGHAIHYRCYQITDVGIREWTSARAFYVNLAPPSPDLTPFVTDEGRWAAYDPDIRKTLAKRIVLEHLQRLASAMLHVDLTPRP